jgi:hypothetical protein
MTQGAQSGNGQVVITYTATSTASLGSSQNPAPVGQSVTFTATVTGAGPTGTVNFKDGGTTISGCGAQPLSGGTATCTSTGLSAGTHSITAVYGGDSGNTASTSPTLTQTVAGPPSVSISSPAGGAHYTLGQKVLASFSCAEGTDGPGLSSCVGSVASDLPIDTSTAGRHTFSVKATSYDGQVTTRTVSYTVSLLDNRLVGPPHLKPHSDGVFIVTVKVPGPGTVDIMVTAWKDNFPRGVGLGQAAALLQPAPGRFVFARAHARANRAGILRIPVFPNRLGRLLVQHHRYRVTLRLWITYTPTRGRARSNGYYGLHLPS